MPTYSMPAGGSICTHEDGCISERRMRQTPVMVRLQGLVEPSTKSAKEAAKGRKGREYRRVATRGSALSKIPFLCFETHIHPTTTLPPPCWDVLIYPFHER